MDIGRVLKKQLLNILVTMDFIRLCMLQIIQGEYLLKYDTQC